LASSFDFFNFDQFTVIAVIVGDWPGFVKVAVPHNRIFLFSFGLAQQVRQRTESQHIQSLAQPVQGCFSFL